MRGGPGTPAALPLLGFLLACLPALLLPSFSLPAILRFPFCLFLPALSLPCLPLPSLFLPPCSFCLPSWVQGQAGEGSTFYFQLSGVRQTINVN